MKITNNDWETLEILWRYLRVNSSLPNQADVIIVGGAGLVTEMAIRAAELYNAGISNKIIVSGFRVATLDMKKSEAMLLKDVLLNNGVLSTDILVDEAATNTGDNIVNSIRLLSEERINTNNVILVHKPFMERRFLATAEAAWPKPQPNFFVTSSSVSLREYNAVHQNLYPHELLRMVSSILGEYKRIKEYPRKGFISEQPIVEEVDNAYNSLIEKKFIPR